MNRRAFLQTIGLAPFASWAGSFDPWVEVNAANLRHNLAEISRRVSGRPILAVIKNNAYGAGIAQVAPILERVSAVAGVAVVKLQEAFAVRDAGFTKPVVLMGPFDDRDLDEAIARDITPMVYTPIAGVLERIAAKRPSTSLRAGQRTIGIQVCVDTGIGRVGVPHRVAGPLIESFARRPSIRIDGVMMTFSEHKEFDREQLTRFTTLCAELQAKGISLGRRHTVSSFGLFQHPDAFLDMVRPGMAIYGVYSEPPFRKTGILQLRPAVALRCRVAYVKQLPAGDSAGYERAYVASKPTWIATLPVGHADGWPRAAAKGARVRIGSQLYPVIASVSASHTIVEIGAEQRVKIGDEATLFDWNAGTLPDDVAASCGASVYDLMMHLGANLPRRVI